VSVYVDASALLKLYVAEPETTTAVELLRRESWWSGRHTLVEVRRNLARLLAGPELETAQRAFASDWRATAVIDLDERTCEQAAVLAETTGVRALDAMHLGAAASVGGGELPVVTFDRRLADAARSLGWPVLGA
jgi:uncharacterized protein